MKGQYLYRFKAKHKTMGQFNILVHGTNLNDAILNAKWLWPDCEIEG